MFDEYYYGPPTFVLESKQQADDCEFEIDNETLQTPSFQRIRKNELRRSLISKFHEDIKFFDDKHVSVSLKCNDKTTTGKIRRVCNVFYHGDREFTISDVAVNKISYLKEFQIDYKETKEPRTEMLLYAFEVFETRFESILEKLNVTEFTNNFVNLASSTNNNNKNVFSKLLTIFKTSPSSYLVSKPGRGLYITCLMHSFDNIIVTADVLLPTVKVECDEVWDVENNFYWLMKVISDWSLLNKFKSALKKEISMPKVNWNGEKDLLTMRYAILNAIGTLQDIIGTEDLGHLHHEMITEGGCTIFLLVNSDFQRPTILSSKTTSILSLTSQSSFTSSWLPVTLPTLSSSLSWMPLRKIFSNECVGKNIQGNNLLKFVTLRSSDIFSSSLKMSEEQLEQGMYIGYLKLAVRIQGLDILVSKQHLSSLPCIKVDSDDADDSDEDIKMVVKYTNVFDDGEGASTKDKNFKNMLHTKCNQLIDAITTETTASTAAVEKEKEKKEADESTTPAAHRLHKLTFPLKGHVNMTLLAPPASLVCPPLRGQLPPPPPSCTYLPLRTFEMLHLNTYQPQIYRKYCQLSAILDLLTEVCRRRKILLEASDESESRDDELVELLEVSHSVQGIQRDINEAWTKYRWLTDVIRQARLTSSKYFVSLKKLF